MIPATTATRDIQAPSNMSLLYRVFFQGNIYPNLS